MGRWLALARADADEKNLKTPVCDTPKTPKTPSSEVLGVLGVSDPSISANFSEPTFALSGGFGGFGGKPKGAFSEKFSALAPSSELVTHPQVVEAEAPEAAVSRWRDEIEMAVPAGPDPWDTARRLIEMAREMAEPGRRYLIQLVDDETSEMETRH